MNPFLPTSSGVGSAKKTATPRTTAGGDLAGDGNDSSNPFAESLKPTVSSDEDPSGTIDLVPEKYAILSTEDPPGGGATRTTAAHSAGAVGGERVRNFLVADGVVLESRENGRVVRRDFTKADGVVAMREVITGLYMDEVGANALVTGAGDVTYYLDLNAPALKLRGPISPLALPITCVTWVSSSLSGSVALVGAKGGNVVRCLVNPKTAVSELAKVWPSSSSSSSSTLPSNEIGKVKYGREEDDVVAICLVGGRRNDNKPKTLVVSKGGEFRLFSDSELSSLERSGSLPLPKGGIVTKVVADSHDTMDAGASWCVASTSGGPLLLQIYPHVEIIKRFSGDTRIEDINQTDLFLTLIVRSGMVGSSSSSSTSSSTLRLFAISKIDPKRLVISISLPSSSAISPIQLSRDPTLNRTYILLPGMSQPLLRVAPIHPRSRPPWKLFCERQLEDGDFRRAFERCETARDRATVAGARGEFLLSRGRFEECAEVWAATPPSTRSFEDICLCLSDASTAALRTFLRAKIRSMGTTTTTEEKPVRRSKPRVKTPKTILCLWLVEVFLNEMGERDGAKSNANERRGGASNEDEEEHQAQEDALVVDFWAFLHEEKDNLAAARDTVFHLLLSHGRIDLLLFYAALVEDHERIVAFHLHRGAPREAVRAVGEALKKRGGARASDAEAVLLKHAGELLKSEPRALVDVLIENAAVVDAVRLVPQLASCQALDELVRYLEHLVFVMRSRAEPLHDLLFASYIRGLPRSAAALEAYVEDQCASGRAGRCGFDPAAAIRLCFRGASDGTDEKSPIPGIPPRVLVRIYDALDEPEEAVEVGLANGLGELAREIARSRSAGKARDERAKRLWTLIVRRALSEPPGSAPNVRRALEAAKASEGVVGVEDLLPLLPEMTRIDQVREEVCAALERCAHEVEALTREMERDAAAAKALRAEAAKTHAKFDVLERGRPCDLCGNPARSVPSRLRAQRRGRGELRPGQLSQTSVANGERAEEVGEEDDDEDEALFVFPCTHVFHSSCLTSHLARHLSPEKARVLSSSSSSTAREREEILGEACALCSDVAVAQLAEPLILASDEAEAASWDI